jgi:chaperonin GroEL (HSP60 family)
MSSDEGRLFKKDPAINVISKEEFEERVDKVFHLLWKTLAKSFGPYGAPTLIYNYPWSHVTKDGYTIFKNLSMDATETLVDQAIADMAGDICGRLNYSVGDGTTSAIIATNSIYQNYRNKRDELKNKFILPRDVIRKYEVIKEKIIKNLQTKVVQIRTEDLEQLKKNIHDVVYISSNGDETITEYISDLYKVLGAPAISCMLAPDGITKKRLIEGYKYDLTINDRLYINSDDQTMVLDDADVIIFATKVTKSTYQNILKPLNTECKRRGRHLIVAAPSYDETALQQVIAVDLNNEYRKEHDVNLVLTTYRAVSAHTRKLINDFAILTNTTIIDRALENSIIDQLSTGQQIFQVFNMDEREIPGLRCLAMGEQTGLYNRGVDELPDGFAPVNKAFPLVENYVDLGFVKHCSLGLKSSQFTDLIYDKKRYEVVLAEARADLEEKEKKYQKLGTFNLEVSQAQERLYALNLKMGIIEVGADTELSQKLLKDAVDDAIKAASSAFNHGVVLGCNTNLIQVISDMYEEETDPVNKTLIEILLSGFIDVYKTVLGNAFDNVTFENYSFEKKTEFENWVTEKELRVEDIFTDMEALQQAIANSTHNGVYTVHDVLIQYSLLTSQVFDISKFRYSTSVINSLQTDEEILKATIDLITILIVGNQMVVTQKHNFID